MALVSRDIAPGLQICTRLHPCCLRVALLTFWPLNLLVQDIRRSNPLFVVALNARCSIAVSVCAA